MPFDIASAAGNEASSLVNTGLGLMLGKYNDDRQYNQQARLQDLQIQGQEKLTDYNTKAQLGLFNNTGYGAQVAQMESAGLNPAMIYGHGGPGGSTAISAGNVSGAEAPKGGHEAIEGGQMGMGLALQTAQMKVMESQANLNNVEAAKRAGADTDFTKAQTWLTQQQIDNARQQFQSIQLDNTIKQIENYEKQTTQPDRIEYISQMTKQAIEQSKVIANQRKISDTTLNDQIKIIQQDAVGSVIRNEVMKIGIHATEQQIKSAQTEIMQNWDKLNLETLKTTLDNQLKMQTLTNTGNAAQETYDNILKAIQAIKGTSGLPISAETHLMK